MSIVRALFSDAPIQDATNQSRMLPDRFLEDDIFWRWRSQAYLSLPAMDPLPFTTYNEICMRKVICINFTPWKINMEPTNHPFRKENDLPNLHDYVPC